MPRRTKTPARDFDLCRCCGHRGLFWPSKATRDKDLRGPLDRSLAICITRAVPEAEYDIHTWDGYYSREGWKSEGRRVSEDPTDDGRVFRVAPVHRCDPIARARWQARNTPPIPALSHSTDPRVPD